MKIVLEKLSSTLLEEVNYTLSNGSETILLNDLIGKTISLNFTGTIFCSKCQVITKQSFGQGFCFSCFNTAPEASPCIIHPELCQAHLGIGRDLDYEEKKFLAANSATADVAKHCVKQRDERQAQRKND